MSSSCLLRKACSASSRTLPQSAEFRRSSKNSPRREGWLLKSLSPTAAKRLVVRWRSRLDSPAVLDSSAILAVVFNEPGDEVVIPLLKGGLLSTVNSAEVHTRLV